MDGHVLVARQEMKETSVQIAVRRNLKLQKLGFAPTAASRAMTASSVPIAENRETSTFIGNFKGTVSSDL